MVSSTPGGNADIRPLAISHSRIVTMKTCFPRVRVRKHHSAFLTSAESDELQSDAGTILTSRTAPPSNAAIAAWYAALSWAEVACSIESNSMITVRSNRPASLDLRRCGSRQKSTASRVDRRAGQLCIGGKLPRVPDFTITSNPISLRHIVISSAHDTDAFESPPTMDG